MYLWSIIDVGVPNSPNFVDANVFSPRSVVTGGAIFSPGSFLGISIPTMLEKIQVGNITLKFKHPLLYRISYNEEFSSYCAIIQKYNIVALGEAPIDVQEVVKQDVGWLWEEYAQVEDAMLADDAKALKYELLNEIEVSFS